MNLIPIGRHVLLKPDEPVKIRGKIIIPEAFYKPVPSGTVSSVSKDKSFQVQPGDHVWHEPGAGTFVEDILVIDEANIIYKC